jgi:hypothetical protein
MTTLLSNPAITDDERRRRLYAGQVMVYSASPASLALVEHARRMIEDAFGSINPQTAQHEMPVEDFAGLLAELKPKFIHHPESKRRLQELLSEFGCDRDKTYFDVPRMRTSTSNDYLSSGISYAFHAPPRYLVLRAVLSIELVDTDLPGGARECHGVSSKVLEQSCTQRLAPLQLLRVEQNESAVRS